MTNISHAIAEQGMIDLKKQANQKDTKQFSASVKMTDHERKHTIACHTNGRNQVGEIF